MANRRSADECLLSVAAVNGLGRCDISYALRMHVRIASDSVFLSSVPCRWFMFCRSMQLLPPCELYRKMIATHGLTSPMLRDDHHTPLLFPCFVWADKTLITGTPSTCGAPSTIGRGGDRYLPTRRQTTCGKNGDFCLHMTDYKLCWNHRPQRSLPTTGDTRSPLSRLRSNPNTTGSYSTSTKFIGTSSFPTMFGGKFDCLIATVYDSNPFL